MCLMAGEVQPQKQGAQKHTCFSHEKAMQATQDSQPSHKIGDDSPVHGKYAAKMIAREKQSDLKLQRGQHFQ